MIDLSRATTLLQGRKLNYLIGSKVTLSYVPLGHVVEVPFDQDEKPDGGPSIAYGNLLDENYDDEDQRIYRPYLTGSWSTDTADEYGEGVIDPTGQGWIRNIRDQVERRKRSQFEIIEWDNPDSYKLKFVLQAHEYAQGMGLYTVAKNPCLTDDPELYLAHPSICCAVVEHGGGTPTMLNDLRRLVKKPQLPCYFVYFGNESKAALAKQLARVTEQFEEMHVTFSPDGEYTSVREMLS